MRFYLSSMRSYFGCLSQMIWERIKALEWSVWFLLLIAFMLVMYSRKYGIYYEGADSYGYVENARFMIGRGGFNFYRTPGTSLFFILTGVVIFETWKILIFSYSIMSLLIPIFVYYIIKINSRPIYGFFGGLVCIFSGIPFVHSKTIINSDHLFIFFDFLFLFLVAIFIYRILNNVKYSSFPYWITIVSFFATLIRPVAAFNFWIFIALSCLFFYKKMSLKHLLFPSLLYMSLNVFWTTIERNHGFDNFSDVYTPANIAERRVGEIYFSSHSFHFINGMSSKPPFNLEQKPATKELRSILRWYISQYPQRWIGSTDIRPFLLFGKFKDNPNNLIYNILNKPTSSYFQFLSEAIQARYGANTTSFFTKLAKEYHNYGFIGVINYFLNNPGKILLGGTDTATLGVRNLLAMAHYTKFRQFMNRQWSLSNSPQTLVTESNGPYSKEYLRAIKFYIMAYPHYWEPIFKEWTGNPEGLYNFLLNPPSTLFLGEGAESLFFEAITRYYGIKAGSQLMINTAKESFLAHPNSLFMFLDNILFITVNKMKGDVLDSWNYDLLKKWARGYIRIRNNHTEGLTTGLKGELQPILDEHWFEPFWICNGIFHQLQVIFFIAAILFSGLLLTKKQSLTIVILWSIYIYNVIAIAVFGAFSSNRYEDVFVLIPVIISCIGLCAFVDAFRKS